MKMAKVRIFTIDDCSVSSAGPSMGKKNKMKKHHRFQKKKKKPFFGIKQKNRSSFDSIKGYKKCYFDGLYGPLVVMLCILGSTCVTLIPAHNVIENGYVIFRSVHLKNESINHIEIQICKGRCCATKEII